MNNIYEKLRPRRRYVRRPLCANVDGMCSFDKCRCGYGLYNYDQTKINLLNNQNIIEESLHRLRVVMRKRQIELYKLDEENLHSDMVDSTLYSFIARGYKPEKKKKVKIMKYIYRAILFSVLGFILWLLILNLSGM